MATPGGAVGFAIPEPLDRVSGGYAYDRALIQAGAALPAPLTLTPIGLPGGYPSPSDNDLAAAAQRLAEHPGPLLIDGLALGAFDAELSAAIGPRTLALVHHPLALETGLTPAAAEALAKSERAALAAAAGVVCTSRDTATRLVSAFGVDPARLAVAEPGIGRSDADRPRSFAPCAGDPPVILAVGAPTWRKNLHGLVDALAASADAPWRLRICGPVDGEAADALAAAIAASGCAARIEQTGPLADLGPAYQSADLFVSASHYEGYGMAAADATAHGLPVLAVAGGAIAETAWAGRLVAAPDALGPALRDLIVNKSHRETLAASSRRAANRLPRWRDTAETVRRCLQRWVSSDGRGEADA